MYAAMPGTSTTSHHWAYGLVILCLGLWFSGSSPLYASEMGMLQIFTEPGDAQIFVNGRRRGNSPAQPGDTFAVRLPEGSHTVEALKPDGAEFLYTGKVEDIFVSDHTIQTLTIILERVSLSQDDPSEEALHENEDIHALAEPIAQLEANMLHIPMGSFQMGCLSGRDQDCKEHERPARVVIVSAFLLNKYEVTFEQWDACVADGGCRYRPSDEGWGRGDRPVINVSYNDIIQQFLPWLNRRTGKVYRLPSETEWEYACRAGENHNFCGSNTVGDVAWYRGNSSRRTHPVGGKAANAFGLHDMSGNVWEWTQDCWNPHYRGAPNDESAWTSGFCSWRVLRSGSWDYDTRVVRAASRIRTSPNLRINFNGFRVARTLP